MDAREPLKVKLSVNPTARGVELKRKQAELVNVLPSINESKDWYALAVAARKARIDDIEAEAILSVANNEEFRKTKSTVQSKVLKAMVRSYVYETDYQETLDKNSPAQRVDISEDKMLVKKIKTTLSIEEHLLGIDMMWFNKARSKADEIVQLLWVCRSGLSFDKEDMSHGSSQ